MKKILTILMVSIIFFGCQDDNVGYLIAEHVKYQEDTLVVKSIANLDLEPRINPEFLEAYNRFYKERVDNGQITEEQAIFELTEWWGLEQFTNSPDYARFAKNAPWVSDKFSGLQGTKPIYVAFSEVESNDGDVDSFLREAKVNGGGVVQIPFKNNIVPGTYIVSFKVWNVAATKYVNNILTVLVEEEQIVVD